MLLLVVLLHLKTFFWIVRSIAAAVAAGNPISTSTLFASGRSTIFINTKLILAKKPRILSRNSPDHIILEIYVFVRFKLDDG